MKKKTKKVEVFTTRPHGWQTIFRFIEEDDFLSNPRNALFSIKNKDGTSLVLTGWEMNDLCNQWIAYRETCDK